MRLGREQGLEALYDASHRGVFALLVRLLRDVHLAEEVLLDVYLQVWRQVGEFDPSRGSTSTWLFTIARSRALDRRRSLEVRMRASSEPLTAERSPRSPSASPGPAGVQAPPRAAREPAADGSDPAAALADLEHADRVREELARLPSDQRQVLELAFFAGLSHGHIAARLGQPLGTIKARIRRGLLRLEELLVRAGVEA
jgi:RNA polymerase sigma-70 factor (ECF subfamily)